MLTDRFCSRVKLREGEVQADYYDEAVSGLALRVGQKKSWTLHYGGRDSRKRLTFGTYPTLGLAAARTKALEAKQEIEAGRSPIKAVDTFKSIAEDWLTRDGANLRSKDKRKSALERLVYDVIGDRPIADIKRSEIVRLLDQIEDNQGPVMADWTLATVRKIMNWHASRSDDFNSPIVRGMSRTKPKERARKRVLSDEELRKVWKAAEASGVFGRLIRFILLTATRRNEAAMMKRSEVKGEDWIIPAERYKTKLDHLIPLSAATQRLLEGDSLIFTTDGETSISGFSKFKAEFDKASGVTGYTIHDLRRSSRSLMSRAGVNSDIAERCLGHVMGGVRGTYDRYEYRDEKLRAFEVLASLIDRIVNPKDNIVPMRAAQ